MVSARITTSAVVSGRWLRHCAVWPATTVAGGAAYPGAGAGAAYPGAAAAGPGGGGGGGVLDPTGGGGVTARRRSRPAGVTARRRSRPVPRAARRSPETSLSTALCCDSLSAVGRPRDARTLPVRITRGKRPFREDGAVTTPPARPPSGSFGSVTGPSATAGPSPPRLQHTTIAHEWVDGDLYVDADRRDQVESIIAHLSDRRRGFTAAAASWAESSPTAGEYPDVNEVAAALDAAFLPPPPPVVVPAAAGWYPDPWGTHAGALVGRHDVDRLRRGRARAGTGVDPASPHP